MNTKFFRKGFIVALVLLILGGCAVSSDKEPVDTNPETSTNPEPSSPVIEVLPTPSEEPKGESANALLASLETDKGVFVPNFSKDVFEYEVLLTTKESSVQFKATTNDAEATIESGLEVVLNKERTLYPLTVTAADGSQKIYQLTIVQPETTVVTPTIPAETAAPEFVHLPTPTSVTYVEDILFVNKKVGLPSDYNPGEDATAGQQIKQLIIDMQAAGLNVQTRYSGFRSFSTQKRLFEDYAKKDGLAKAETYSARPGFSEHQSGLAFDLFTKDGRFLGNGGRDSEETAWLDEHAASYGFIVRYLDGKTDITGYRPEPWHLRYIGNRAQEIKDSGLTLEEFFDMPSGDYQR